MVTKKQLMELPDGEHTLLINGKSHKILASEFGKKHECLNYDPDARYYMNGTIELSDDEMVLKRQGKNWKSISKKVSYGRVKLVKN